MQDVPNLQYVQGVVARLLVRVPVRIHVWGHVMLEVDNDGAIYY